MALGRFISQRRKTIWKMKYSRATRNEERNQQVETKDGRKIIMHGDEACGWTRYHDSGDGSQLSRSYMRHGGAPTFASGLNYRTG